MKPNLGGDDRPQGPQMFATGGGHRSTGPFDDGTSYGYTGQVPDYVVGTDWKKSLSATYQVAEAAPVAHRLAVRDDAPAPAVLKWAQPDETPAEPVTYPSLAGGKTYGADAPPADEAAPPAEPDPDAG